MDKRQNQCDSPTSSATKEKKKFQSPKNKYKKKCDSSLGSLSHEEEENFESLMDKRQNQCDSPLSSRTQQKIKLQSTKNKYQNEYDSPLSSPEHKKEEKFRSLMHQGKNRFDSPPISPIHSLPRLCGNRKRIMRISSSRSNSNSPKSTRDNDQNEMSTNKEREQNNTSYDLNDNINNGRDNNNLHEYVPHNHHREIDDDEDDDDLIPDLDHPFGMIKCYKLNLYRMFKKKDLLTLPVIDNEAVRYSEMDGKIYLGGNVKVGKDTWAIMKRKKTSLFLRELAAVIFKRKLENMCLDIGKVKNSIPGRSPVKILCPIKLELYLRLFKDYIDSHERYKNVSKKLKNTMIRQSTDTLSKAIRSARNRAMLQTDSP